ncbi:MAG: DMT family transporter [Caulobacteraceae bacterium]
MTAAPVTVESEKGASLGLDLGSVALCSLIWGTTWYVITFQFGQVPPAWSIAYRFALASLVLFGLCASGRQKLGLTRAQHVSAFMLGLFTFAIDYALVYAAEEKVVSAVVAVVFASLALVNLVVFRIVSGRKSSGLAWGGALLGVAGVGVLSAGELLKADMSPTAWLGIVFALGAVLAGAIGNLFASRAGDQGAAVLPATAWGMLYGAGQLAVWALATGHAPAFEFTSRYVLSLLYLSVFGSVIAFAVFYMLARRRGYTFASYIAALTPPTAMLISAIFEHAKWGLAALAGLALVIAGQVLLIKAQKT